MPRKKKTPSPQVVRVRPQSIEESIEQARTATDAYGYRERFRQCSVDELIDAFNAQVGVAGWVSARAVYLTALADALLATGLDCSSFISEKSMALGQRVERRGDAIVPKGAGP